MKYNILSKSFFILFSSAILIGCADDLLDYPMPEVGEGAINATIAFEPFTGISEDTRTNGDAIKSIESLNVIVYRVRESGDELVKVFSQSDLSSYTISTNEDMPSDIGSGYGEHQAEAKTAQASFTLPPLPYDTYRIYAVANTDITGVDLSDINNLKNKKLTWNADDISKNNQMFGYFTKKEGNATGGSLGYNAPPITINGKNNTIHAWIKRAASKVTVAFDPSGLHQSIWIYIHDVSIRSIPSTCLLGADNTPKSESDILYDYDEPLSSLPSSAKIIYEKDGNDSYATGDFKESDVAASKAYTNWLTLDKGSGVQGSVHSETANALFFYENIQPNENGNTKVVTPQNVGTCITSPDQEGFKNNIRWGTYIEVTGYYVSTNPDNTTQGKIKYRFMLGKNETDNFEAQRNHHYKLTLGFNGWANQPKWNIEYYEEEPGIEVPETFYVSYLYNQKHMMPIKIVGECTNLRMEITENNWAPYDPNTSDHVPAATVGSGENAFRWNRAAWQTYNGTNAPYLGFLALTVPSNTALPPKNIITDMTFSDGTAAFNALNNYYTGAGGTTPNNTLPQNHRDFSESQLNPTGGNGAGAYNIGYNGWQVKRVDSQSKMVMVPLFTRNKTMIMTSGFSGNNPYDSYQRKAVVRITGTFKMKDGTTREISQYVNVMQVRRIVNPKGVWRRWDRTTPFDVKLLRINDVSAISSNSYFSEFESEGPWKAYIETGNGINFLKLNTSGSSYKTPEGGDTIFGNTGTPIEFQLDFNGTVASTQSACAVVRVEYHGNQCVHKIMVRKGYINPLALIDGGKRWSSFSLFSCGSNGDTSGSHNNIQCQLTASPLALGSLFKRHNTLQGILVSNNATYGPLVTPNQGTFTLTNNTNRNWANITRANNQDGTSWGTFRYTRDGQTHTYKVPDYDDFKALMECEFGYGVLYGSGVSTTQTTYDGAYGFADPDNNESGADFTKGTRGIMVYNRTDGRQIFFPLGPQGMGRRSEFNMYRDANHNNVAATYRPNYYGMLRYGDTTYPLTNEWGTYNIYRPIPYNLPYTAGAVYWIDIVRANGGGDGVASGGWDMNYFNFDFNPYTNNNNMDACPIKFVVVE